LCAFQAIERIRNTVVSEQLVACKAIPLVAFITTNPKSIFIIFSTEYHSTTGTLSIVFNI